jgi:hypothetical protein
MADVFRYAWRVYPSVDAMVSRLKSGHLEAALESSRLPPCFSQSVADVLIT